MLRRHESVLGITGVGRLGHICLRSRGKIKEKNNEVRRLLFGEADAGLEGSLLSVWALECYPLLAIEPELCHLLWPKRDRLKEPIFFNLEVYGR